MSVGKYFQLVEVIERDGSIARFLAEQSPPIAQSERDLRQHYTFAGSYPAGHERRIEAGVPIRLDPPGPFTKIAITIRSAHVAYIAFDKDAGSGLGQYDELHPGNARLEERIKRSTSLSIVFPVVPPDPVEVTVYAGDPAKPS